MIRFLVKGLLRDRSRSLFPFLIVAIGVSLTVFLDAYIRGAADGMFRTTATFLTGHVRVTTRARSQEGSYATNELALLAVDKLLSELRRDFPDIVWTPRIRFSGLADIPDSAGLTRAQAPVTGIAIDLSASSPERNLLKLDAAVVRGRLPVSPSEVLVSEEFARRLNISPGEKLTLITSTMHGSLSATNFVLAGTIRFGVTTLDRSLLLADIRGIRHALDMEDAADEILGFQPRGQYDEPAAMQIAARFNAHHHKEDEFTPVLETLRTASGMAGLIDIMNKASALISAVFVLAMAIVLWNAGLIGSLRRYGEVGLRLALGESKVRVYATLLAESLFIGLAGSTVGTLLGLGASYYLQETGINIAGMMQNATIVMDDVIRARIAAPTFFIGFLPGFFATFLGAAISGLGVFKRKTAALMKELSA